jgi:hypothetical protein
MVERCKPKAAGAGTEEERPPMTAEQFEASPEFRQLKSAMRKLIKVPKSELDNRVRAAKEASARVGNPNAPGRKRRPHAEQ